ncbi:MAG: imidazole glycerol phosphate synthase subunit HisH [Rhodothermales bacterium]
MITIIDYGIGNLRSIEKAFERVGAEVLRTDDTDRIAEAKRLVLPGVGAFGACADEIRRRDLEPAIHHAVGRGIPFLGVCVGMQLLFDGSDEMGKHRGLGLIPGRVTRFSSDMSDTEDRPLKVPHMGWNTTAATRTSPLLADLPESPYFYFVHSYHAVPQQDAHILATCNYGMDFPAMVHRDNIYGAQFHPEKSQDNGLAILANFSRL